MAASGWLLWYAGHIVAFMPLAIGALSGYLPARRGTSGSNLSAAPRMMSAALGDGVHCWVGEFYYREHREMTEDTESRV